MCLIVTLFLFQHPFTLSIYIHPTIQSFIGQRFSLVRLKLCYCSVLQTERCYHSLVFQSTFSGIRPILVRMLRKRKKPTVAAAISTSATQKAMSQLCCLAMVLKGSPAMKAPTVGQETQITVQLHLYLKMFVQIKLCFLYCVYSVIDFYVLIINCSLFK